MTARSMQISEERVVIVKGPVAFSSCRKHKVGFLRAIVDANDSHHNFDPAGKWMEPLSKMQHIQLALSIFSHFPWLLLRSSNWPQSLTCTMAIAEAGDGAIKMVPMSRPIAATCPPVRFCRNGICRHREKTQSKPARVRVERRGENRHGVQKSQVWRSP